MQSAEFVTLKQVHDDFQEAANLTRYYNLCAYLTGKFSKVFLIIEIVTKSQYRVTQIKIALF